MCRIAGIIGFPDHHSGKLTRLMNESMVHGGPDDQGIYHDESNLVCLGNRRLSLLDLSPNGHQPMVSKNGKYVITYNGEVYNFKEISAQLNLPDDYLQSGTDTEIILHAFQKWGEAAFAKFNGMFAIAIYDTEKKELILVRDPSGIKPLYYSFDSRGLIFASEVKAFTATNLNFESNPDWKILLLAHGHIPEPHTTYKSVKMLPRGSFLKYSFSSKKTVIKPFYSYTFSNNITEQENAVIKIRETLTDGIKRQLLADAPVGVFLSGGIDSGIIASVASRHSSHSLKTLSVVFDEQNYSERKYQELLVKKINSDHTYFTLTERDFNDALPNIFRGMDQPSSDGMNTWFIASCAKRVGLKAVLSGIGADELLGGYPSFHRMNTINWLKKIPNGLLELSENLGNDRLSKLAFLSNDDDLGAYLFIRGFFAKKAIVEITETSLLEVNQVLENQHYGSKLDFLKGGNKASYLEMFLYMQNQLLKDTDTMSMQHGIEVRVPFLDKEFVETVLSIDPALKFKGKMPKHLLIEAFKDILPEEIWNRPKMGFNFPYQVWFKRNDMALKLLGHRNLKIKNLAQMYLDNKLQWSRLYAVILTEEWQSC